MTQTGPSTETFNDTVATQRATVAVVPRTIAQSEQIARYFIEDLEYFIEDTHIDLMYELGIPPDQAQDSREIINKLFDDLSHLLRYSMITGIHILLSEPKADPNNHNMYALRYHAEYTINASVRSLKSDRENYSSQRINGYLAPKAGMARDARFALLITWNESMNERRRHASQPEYWFNWIPRQEQFDHTTLVRFRDGGMVFDGANVVSRAEYTTPGY